MKCVCFCVETVKENLQLIYFYIEVCMAASRNISMFFNERAAVYKKDIKKKRLHKKKKKENVLLLKDINI